MLDRLPEEDKENTDEEVVLDMDEIIREEEEMIARYMYYGPYAHYPEFWDIENEDESVDGDDIGDNLAVVSQEEEEQMEEVQDALQGNQVDVGVMWNVVNTAQLWIDSDCDREKHRATLNQFTADVKHWELNARVWLSEHSEESIVHAQETAVLPQRLLQKLADSSKALIAAISGNTEANGQE